MTKGDTMMNDTHTEKLSLSVPVNANAPAHHPSSSEPESPRKMLAGGRFQNRKPSEAPAATAASQAPAVSPASPKAKANRVKLMTAWDDARPSDPSMKLKRFMSQTMAMTAIGVHTQAAETAVPAILMDSTGPSHNVIPTAPRNWMPRRQPTPSGA